MGASSGDTERGIRLDSMSDRPRHECSWCCPCSDIPRNRSALRCWRRVVSKSRSPHSFASTTRVVCRMPQSRFLGGSNTDNICAASDNSSSRCLGSDLAFEARAWSTRAARTSRSSRSSSGAFSAFQSSSRLAICVQSKSRTDCAVGSHDASIDSLHSDARSWFRRLNNSSASTTGNGFA